MHRVQAGQRILINPAHIIISIGSSRFQKMKMEGHIKQAKAPFQSIQIVSQLVYIPGPVFAHSKHFSSRMGTHGFQPFPVKIKRDKIQTALNNFFKAEHILQLRELALKEVALRVEKKVENTIPENLGVRHERFMACISSNEKTPRKIIRKVARLATRYNSKFFVLYVQTPRESSDRIPLASQRHLLNHFKLATELGGEIIQVQSPHITDAIVQACKEKQISTLCIGRPALKYPSAILAMVHYRNMLEELAQLGIDLIILA